MRPLKFIGIELKSMPQFIGTLLLTPAVMVYLIWDKLSNVNITLSSSVFPANPTLQDHILFNLTRKTGIFTSFTIAQQGAFYNAVSVTILFEFLVGGLLAAAIFGVPMTRGTIIHDIASLGSKRKTLAVRGLFLILCALLLAGLSAIFLFYLPQVFGVHSDIRFLLSVLTTSFLTIITSAALVLSLVALSRDLIVPLIGVFAVFIGTFGGSNLSHLLLPFKDLTFVLWNAGRFGHPGAYIYTGLAIYGALTVLSVKAFEGGDYY